MCGHWQQTFFLPLSRTGARSSFPSGARLADDGHGQRRGPSRSREKQTGSIHNAIIMPTNNSFLFWPDRASNCWPLEEQTFAEGFTVNASFKTSDTLVWRNLLLSFVQADGLRETRGLCLNCHEDNNYFTHCRYSFINASCCLNSKLGHLGDDDAYRRWRARKIYYSLDGNQFAKTTTRKIVAITQADGEGVPPGSGPNTSRHKNSK